MYNTGDVHCCSGEWARFVMPVECQRPAVSSLITDQYENTI